MSLKKTHNR